MLAFISAAKISLVSFATTLRRRHELTQLMGQASAGDHIILYFPDYRSHNPHQQLLAKAMPAGCHYYSGSIGDALYLQKLQKLGVKITFHLHWPDQILWQPFFSLFLKQLAQFKQRGGHTLWSIHNLYPRTMTKEQATSRLRQIASHIDQFHLFTPAYRDTAAAIYGFSDAQCKVAARGSYAGYYPDTITRDEARRKLGVKANEFLVCFFGQLRPYKGLDRLAEASLELPAMFPQLRLLVTGKSRVSDYRTMRPIIRQLQSIPYAKVHQRFLADVQIQYPLKAADVLVIPYADITNSGSLLLALSFGCCVIAPRLGSIPMIVTSGVNAILYDPEDAQGLKDALIATMTMPATQRETIGANALARAKEMRWENLAEKLFVAKSGQG